MEPIMDENLSVWAFGYFKHGQTAHDNVEIAKVNELEFLRTGIAIAQVSCGGVDRSSICEYSIHL
jgi:hypothetical protein